MKKQICTLLLLALVGGCLAGCESGAGEPPTGESVAQTESGGESQTGAPDTGYLSVECHEATGFDACYFGMADHSTALTLRLPRN